MRLFYCREKPTALLRHRSKSIKKHMFRWNLYVRIFLFKRKLLKHLWKRKKMEHLNAWLRNCRSIFDFMKKEIKDTKRERLEGKYLESSWAVFVSIFVNNKGPSQTLKGRTFFFIIFAEKFILQITWNTILYHWDASPAINYGKLLFLFFLKIFPEPRPFPFSFDLLLIIV